MPHICLCAVLAGQVCSYFNNYNPPTENGGTHTRHHTCSAVCYGQFTFINVLFTFFRPNVQEAGKFQNP